MNWIPVTEKMPPNDSRLLVTLQGFGDTKVEFAEYADGKFYVRNTPHSNVIAWMICPEAYVQPHKECPFCGSKPKFLTKDFSGVTYARIECSRCKAGTYARKLLTEECMFKGTTKGAVCEEEVWDDWDKRVIRQ